MESALAIADQRTAESDTDRIGHLFDAQQNALFRFALRVAGDRDEAMDLVQEAFLRALRNIRRLPADERGATSWMYRVITNLAHDRYRRRRVRELARGLIENRPAAIDPTDATISADDVRRALTKLPPKQRAAIALCVFDGRTTADAAAVLCVAEVTVRWHLSKARKALAALLGARE